MSAPSLAVALGRDRAELARLAALVREFAAAQGLPDDVAYAVQLAAEELAANALEHGGADTTHVRLSRAGHEVTLEVEDDGRAFDPLAGPDPDVAAPVAERPVGGLGLFLVRQLMDEADYQRLPDRNLVRLKKRWA